ncbi:MAG: O-antigen ligase family protein [Brevundimonas sp.]
MFDARALQVHRFALSLAGLVATLPLVQLIPLPPNLALNLPGREDLSQALALAGVVPGWTPMSLTPDLTWRSFLALVPPLAVFGAVLTLDERQRTSLLWPVLLAGVLAVGLCAVQITTRSPSAYLWSWTEPGFASGLFANRNHMATLCASTLPFAVILAIAGARDRARGRLRLWIGLSYLGLVVVALPVIQSRAGVGIGLLSLTASLFAAWTVMGRRLDSRLLATGLVAAAALTATVLFGLDGVAARFEGLDLTNGRAQHWPFVIQAAQAYLPVGSGIGSFDAVYRSVEPLQQLDETYFNAAHNEYLQIWLEAGWLGIGLLVAFLVWFGRRSWTTWTAGPDSGFRRAATIAIGVILLHSLVEYPLRTETLAVFFALCCGILEFAGKSQGEKLKPA